MSHSERIDSSGSAPPDPAPSAEYYATVRELFREHNRALVNFLLTRVPSQQDALDVAQECYVRLLELDRPGAVGFLRGYMFRIAANLAIDRMRRTQVRERESIELFDEPMADDVAHRAMTDQEIERVAEALQHLPPKCREAFVLHMVEGHDTAEIAARMNVRDRQVRRYVARALRFCQDWLEGKVTENGRPADE
jgi:RNA polymerase sigma factor (sigma-70 family)